VGGVDGELVGVAASAVVAVESPGVAVGVLSRGAVAVVPQVAGEGSVVVGKAAATDLDLVADAASERGRGGDTFVGVGVEAHFRRVLS